MSGVWPAAVRESSSATPSRPPWAQVRRGAAARLSAEDQALMALFFVEHRTLREIAAALSVHKSTVSRRLAVLQQEVLGAARTALRTPQVAPT